MKKYITDILKDILYRLLCQLYIKTNREAKKQKELITFLFSKINRLADAYRGLLGGLKGRFKKSNPSF